ncbi:hypothetical protein SAMN04324258_0938 [Krasilnikoviella flava]|uniref:Uncharacterized protein n=1 Tax=Krasilnikoviella flava TaxID=526729 RepID=A0A1T5IUX7_9MICO|nr:hypothetical protein SAMN04324258_0938 [Krasilnikoviella flava]
MADVADAADLDVQGWTDGSILWPTEPQTAALYEALTPPCVGPGSGAPDRADRLLG